LKKKGMVREIQLEECGDKISKFAGIEVVLLSLFKIKTRKR
jgi:hypothetical protein